MAISISKIARLLRNASIRPGIIAAGIILAVAIIAFWALLSFAAKQNQQSTVSLLTVFSDDYLWYVIRFTLLQATLSAFLSVIPALFLAKALFRRRFYGRTALLRLFSMTMILPVLVALFGLLSVYGHAGWIAQFLTYFGINWTASIYGLQGILLAHVFFNLPLATRLFLQCLQAIPVEQRQLAAQLGLSTKNTFLIIEWPALKNQLLPCFALIFMLCFASFATVLTLGGGPKATTLEVAIYQALNYDFDLQRAAILGLLQLLFCLGFVFINQRLIKPFNVNNTLASTWRNRRDSKLLYYSDTLIIAAAILFILPPLLAVLLNGLSPSLIELLTRAELWQAISTSTLISLTSSLLSVSLAMMLLWTIRELRSQQKIAAAQAFELSGMTILAMPAIVLATGLFLAFNASVGLPESPYLLVILINAFMAIPYCLKLLDAPMSELHQRYRLLCLSLNIHGLSRFKLIELIALKRPIMQAIAFTAVLSLGDFGVIALFGSEDFMTLPFYLYQQLGSYRTNDAAMTALILLLLCFMMFTVIERTASSHDKN